MFPGTKPASIIVIIIIVINKKNSTNNTNIKCSSNATTYKWNRFQLKFKLQQMYKNSANETIFPPIPDKRFISIYLWALSIINARKNNTCNHTYTHTLAYTLSILIKLFNEFFFSNIENEWIVDLIGMLDLICKRPSFMSLSPFSSTSFFLWWNTCLFVCFLYRNINKHFSLL